MSDNAKTVDVSGASNASAEGPVVRIRGLHKAYGDNVVLRGIDLDVHRGEVVVVLGPSGSGKSTMLRCVNLLETPTQGSIVVEGVDITKRAWISTRCGRRSAWYSSSSTCSRIFPPRRTS